MFRKILLVLFVVAISFLLLPDQAAATGCDPANIIFSEIDYAQPGADGAEFVELYFVAGATVTDCEVQLIDGNQVTPYFSVDIGGVYSAGEIILIGSDSLVPTPDYLLGCDRNCIENGSADGVALVDTTGGGTSVEAVISYEGFFTYGDVRSSEISCEDPSADWSCQNGPAPGNNDWSDATPTPGSLAPTAITLSTLTAGTGANSVQVLGLSFLLLTLTGLAGWILNRSRQA